MSRPSSQPPPSGARPRQTADLQRRVAQGKIDAVGTATLVAGADSTTIDTDGAIYATEASAVLLSPRTANAAAALASGALYVTPSDGQFVITHPNNGQTDRTFAYAVLG